MTRDAGTAGLATTLLLVVGFLQMARRTVGPSEAIVSVPDDGMGIGADDMTRLFQPFTQVGAGQHLRGTGLGLYIAKGIAEQHGGRVWAESPGAGRGSTFFVAVPRLAAKAPPLGAPRPLIAR